MFNPFQVLLKELGKPFSVERNNEIVGQIYGVNNRYDGKKSIDFEITEDVRENDFLINSMGEKFYIDEIRFEYLGQNATHKVAFYKTEKQLQQHTQKQSNTIHINNAYGSVIGNQSDFSLNYNTSLNDLKNMVEKSDSTDKNQLSKIVDILEMIVDNQIPPSKGLFSKFSDVIQKNSWITNHIGSVIVSWLTNQI